MKLKSEKRSSKSALCAKLKKPKNEKPKSAAVGFITNRLPSDYEFVSDFEFRLRDLS